eukprot:2041727-Rhodomonas_salina.1
MLPPKDGAGSFSWYCNLVLVQQTRRQYRALIRGFFWHCFATVGHCLATVGRTCAGPFKLSSMPLGAVDAKDGPDTDL